MWKFIILNVGTVVHVSESTYVHISDAQQAGQSYKLTNDLWQYSSVEVIPYM